MVQIASDTEAFRSALSSALPFAIAWTIMVHDL